MSDQATLSARAQQKADTRRAILRAAERVFLAQPPSTARFEDVAAEAGVSKATVFFHFGTRNDLLAALAYRLYVRRAVVTEGAKAGGLRHYLQTYLDGMQLPEVRLVWQLGDLIGGDHPAMLDGAYVHLTSDLATVLESEGLTRAQAKEAASVLCPALMMVGRRAASDLGGPTEVDDFIAAAIRLTRKAHR